MTSFATLDLIVDGEHMKRSQVWNLETRLLINRYEWLNNQNLYDNLNPISPDKS